MRTLLQRDLTWNPFEFACDAVAVPIARANVDTDQIVPARYLQKPRADNFGDYLFRDLRCRGRRHARSPTSCSTTPPTVGARIVVAERNFGCGSSREHAVWALYDYGIRAAIAPSFGDIFASNALKNGLLPIVLPERAGAMTILELLAAHAGHAHACRSRSSRRVIAPGRRAHRFDVDPFAKHCLLEGLDEIGYTLSRCSTDRGVRSRYAR